MQDAAIGRQLHAAWTGLQADADRLYQALESDPDILLPALGKFGRTAPVEPLLDDRLAPIINRYISLGGDTASDVIIENRLSREENWIHFYKCEIDRVDEAAERLLRQTRQ